MAMILFFVDIDVFFIYFFFSKRQRSLRSSLRFHRIRSAVICNIVTVTVSTRWEIFFFKTIYIHFFRSRKGQVGRGNVSVKIISIIGIVILLLLVGDEFSLLNDVASNGRKDLIARLESVENPLTELAVTRH